MSSSRTRSFKQLRTKLYDNIALRSISHPRTRKLRQIKQPRVWVIVKYVGTTCTIHSAYRNKDLGGKVAAALRDKWEYNTTYHLLNFRVRY